MCASREHLLQKKSHQQQRSRPLAYGAVFSMGCDSNLSFLRKTAFPGYVETPGRKSRSRKSTTPDTKQDPSTVTLSEASELEVPTKRKITARKSQSNGTANGHVKDAQMVMDGREEGEDPRIDYSGHVEFGGSWGVSAMMIGFPLLMYYMWIGATYYDGHLPLPSKGQSRTQFFKHIAHLVYGGAFPTTKAWTIYWGFFVFEAACYLLLPGITVKGKPLPHEGGKRLTYHCSGIWSFYVTIAGAAALHYSGMFKLYTIIDEFGPIMSVAIITGFIISFVAYFSAIYRGAEHRMSGYPIYDFFMGAELNPRMFGLLDFKMFSEVRLPWYILFLLSCGAAARQYEQFGYVSGEVGFLVMAHFLYANACSKAEECIVTTW